MTENSAQIRKSTPEEDNAAEQERDRYRQAILDIDAHATPIGLADPNDPEGNPHHYAVTVGALHRALGRVGHTAAPCTAEAAIARIRDVCDQLWRASVLADGEPHTDRERGVIQAITRVLAALAQPPAHDSGPTVAEAAAHDAAHWDNKHAGEAP